MFSVRFSRVFATMSVLLICGLATAFIGPGASAGATVAPAASTGSHCTFNGSALPLVTGVSAGSKIAISCTGLPACTPICSWGRVCSSGSIRRLRRCYLVRLSRCRA